MPAAHLLLYLGGFFLVCNPSVLAAGPPLKRYQATQPHMGTRVTIVLYATDDESANRGFRAAFTRIGQLDERLSDYRGDSELSRLSRSAPADPSTAPVAVPVSCDLWRVLAYSQRLSQQTNGAFDVTVGPLTRLWRRARRQRAMPKASRLRQALTSVGYRHMRLAAQHHTVTLLRPGMRLDLGAVAKGYAADEGLKKLVALGMDRALVNAGGDMAMGRAPPDRAGWKIGVAPLDAGKPPSRMLLLAQCAIATSGDAWQFVEIGGRRYSHILDPRTGLGLTCRSSVTVVARDAMRADSLASAVSVLGPEQGLPLIEQAPGTSALIVRRDKDRIHFYESTAFRQLCTAEPCTGE